mgnify:CR=1 FL=1
MSHFYFYDTTMELLRIRGIQRMREEIRRTEDGYINIINEVCDERDEYVKALQDILNATTVGQMVAIADRVLRENGER